MRLATPVDAFGAQAVFHGHAHHGTLEGRTPRGVPVYNVAMPLLRKLFDRRFRVVEIACPAEEPAPFAHDREYVTGPH